MDTVQVQKDRSPFFSSPGGMALPFDANASGSVRRGAANSRAQREPRALAAVSDETLRAELRNAGQRTVALRNGVSRRSLYQEIVRRWGPGAGLALRQHHELDMSDRAVAQRAKRPPKRGAAPRTPVPASRFALRAAPLSSLSPVPPAYVPVRVREAVASIATWTIQDWLDWHASASHEEHRALIEYGTAVLNSPIPNAVPVLELTRPRPGSHDLGHGNVDIRAGKPKPEPSGTNRQP